MRHFLIAALAATALAGCGQPSPSGGNAAGEGTKAADTTPSEPAAAAFSIRPGKWENTYEVLEASGEGIPAMALARMKGQPQTHSSCVTPEQAKGEGFRELLGKSGGKCQFTKYEVGNGAISTALRCDMATGKVESQSTGTYTDSSYESVGEGKMDMRGMSLTIKTRNSGRWVGECTGKEGKQ